MKNFALIGASGYIAPRHMRAVKETNNNLVCSLDPFDSVGIIDSYFPNCDFFTEFERFDRHIDMLRRENSSKAIDYVSICSPNYLHDSHIRFALRSGANAICEKPIVLNEWNIEGLMDFEKNHGKNVYTILQLRLHKTIQDLKKKILIEKSKNKYDVDLSYITSRGNWYKYSWKGDINKSGGIATNIGVHFFDMLYYIFGNVENIVLHHSSENKASGFIEYENARVRWFLSLDSNDIPTEIRDQGQRTFRSIKINNEELEFSSGFTELHTEAYNEIIKGNGFSLKENISAISTVSQLRNMKPIGKKGDFHPFLLNDK
jgi:UDP-N-acetyl-2-amino-2-deoxyglucuronate dehydrogenase